MNDAGLSILAVIVVTLLGLALVESGVHRRRVRAIPVRVHVNGTRGKSSVTRLIAAGLRAGGLRTVAKTTGTVPRLIRPDGSEEPIYRVSRPNVLEQLQVVRRALRLRADALVVECMALEPFLQWVSSAHLLQPTHGLITNVRADHLEVMGPTTEDVARALAGSAPYGGTLYVVDRDHAKLLKRVCRERGSGLVVVDPEDQVSEEELATLPYIEHAENVALALEVCQGLGVSRDVALAGMRETRPDAGALTVDDVEIDGRSVTFVNGFAANDPESTEKVWELALARAGRGKRRIALVNCRIDRPERSRQLGRAVVSWTPADSYVVVGSGTQFFTTAAERRGLDRGRMHVGESERASTILGWLSQLSGDRALVVGLGNISGVGLELLDSIRAGGRQR